MKEEIGKILIDLMDAWRLANPDDDRAVLTPDMILDCAVRIYNSQQINKNQSQGKFSSPSLASDVNALATEKQIHLIKTFNIPYYAGMTKKEASKLIAEKLGK